VNVPYLLSTAIAFGLIAYFWPHCAVPCMVFHRVRRPGYVVAQVLTVATLIGLAVAFAINVAGMDKGALHLVVWLGSVLLGGIWVALVGAMLWPRYSILVSAFGR